MNIDFPSHRVYSVNVENVTVELLVEESLGSADELVGMTAHTHAYAELFACLNGQMAICGEMGEIDLAAGDLAIVPANVRHVSRRESAGSDYRALGLRLIRRSGRNSTNLYRRLAGLCASGGAVIRGRPALCAGVAALVSSRQDDTLPALRLALLLLEMAEMRESHSEDKMPMLSDRDLNRVSKLDYLINSCFMNPLTTASVADQLFVSQRQLSRIVKKRYGVSLHQAVTDKRISVAAKMLADSSESVLDIAQAVGFGSVHSFYRAFTARYGLSPQEYRRRLSVQK